MTFVHFVNCMALAYAPIIVTYKCSILSEYNAFFKCVFASLVYLCTQLAKMMVLATFFPSFDADSGNLVSEALKTSVDLLDIYGIHFIINRTVGKPNLKVMIASVGWGGSQALFSNFFNFFFGARSQEFDWKYLQMAFDSNINLAHVMSIAALVWVWTRTDLKAALKPFVSVFLFLAVFRDLLVQVVAQSLLLNSWFVLLLRVGTTAVIGSFSLQLYAGFTENK